MMLCFQLLTGRLFEKETEIGPGQKSVLQSVEAVQDVTGGLEDFPLSSDVYIPAWVKVNGTVYRPGMTVFMTCTTDGDPQFGNIKKNVTLNDNVNATVLSSSLCFLLTRLICLRMCMQAPLYIKFSHTGHYGLSGVG